MFFSVSNAVMVFHIIQSSGQNPIQHPGFYVISPQPLPSIALSYVLLLSLLLGSDIWVVKKERTEEWTTIIGKVFRFYGGLFLPNEFHGWIMMTGRSLVIKRSSTTPGHSNWALIASSQDSKDCSLSSFALCILMQYLTYSKKLKQMWCVLNCWIALILSIFLANSLFGKQYVSGMPYPASITFMLVRNSSAICNLLNHSLVVPRFPC